MSSQVASSVLSSIMPSTQGGADGGCDGGSEGGGGERTGVGEVPHTAKKLDVADWVASGSEASPSCMT